MALPGDITGVISRVHTAIGTNASVKKWAEWMFHVVAYALMKFGGICADECNGMSFLWE
jgi:hypothetical protein